MYLVKKLKTLPYYKRERLKLFLSLEVDQIEKIRKRKDIYLFILKERKFSAEKIFGDSYENEEFVRTIKLWMFRHGYKHFDIFTSPYRQWMSEIDIETQNPNKIQTILEEAKARIGLCFL